MLLRSSRTLRWRLERERSLRASAKRAGVMGRLSADMACVNSVLCVVCVICNLIRRDEIGRRYLQSVGYGQSLS